MKKFAPIIITFAAIACGALVPPVVDAPDLPPGEQWFCCDAAGNCALATSACGPGEDLQWCNVVGEDPATGLQVCLD